MKHYKHSKFTKHSIAYWEKGEKIISQTVKRLPGGRYKHIEIVKYPKRRYK